MKKLLLLASLTFTVVFGFSQCVVTDTLIVNPTCNNSYDGSITLTVTGGSGSYEFYWDGSPGTETNSNLGGGTYTVWITDMVSCSITESYSIIAPPQPVVSVATTDASCYEMCNGMATITVTGNSAPYSFIWLEDIPGDEAGSDTFINVCPSFYPANLIEENGCVTSFEFTVSSPLALYVMMKSYPTSCTGPTGSADAMVSDGTYPYSYLWSNGSTDFMIDSLGLGIYYLTVTDAHGCTEIGQAAVSSYGPTVYIMQDSTIRCYGESTADLMVQAFGQPPFSFYWSTGYEILDTTSMYVRYEDLPAGMYSVTVVDGNLTTPCPNMAMIVITEPELIGNDIDVKNNDCYSDSTGSINIISYGGTIWTGYHYIWQYDTANTWNNAPNLVAGTYYLTVSDDNGCTVTEEIIVNQPDSAYMTPSVYSGCYGMNNASVLLNAFGGTTPYYFDIDSTLLWQEFNNYDSLPPGSHTFYIKDSFYCYGQPVSVTITEPAILSLTPASTPADCADPATGTAEVSVAGGTLPYSYLWSDLSVTPIISSIIPGNYSATVTDANGCIDSVQVPVSQLALASVSGTVQFSMGYLLQNSATVYLYKHIPNIVALDSSDAVLVASGGSFLFDNVLPGDYSIKVSSDTSVYPLLLNTWYDQKVNWQGAAVITAGCEDIIDTVAVQMVETHVLTGMGTFSGLIYYWDNIKGYYEVGEPVEGAEIFVEQQPNDEPLVQASSDVNGYYNITGLEENSSYDLSVDIAGLPLLSTYNNLPVTSMINNYENLNFYVDTTNTFGGIFVDSSSFVKPVSFSVNMPVVYPNPVRTTANVVFTIDIPSEYSWSLFDETGRFIDGISPVILGPGSYEYKIPVSGKGAYVLVNKLGNNSFIRKLLSE